MNKIKKYIFLTYILINFAAFSQQEFNIELVESTPIETTLDNPDIRNTQEVWLEMINSAQKSLDIEQFYITNQKGEPLDTILNAIVAAAKRGVMVRVIVDSEMYKTYPEDVDWLYHQDLNIVRRVIDIKSITGGIQHAKFFIVDDKEVFLGSQNFDWRALKHIHELGVRINHKDCIGLYKSIFEYDWCFSGVNNKDSCSFSFPYIIQHKFYDKNLDSIVFIHSFSSLETVRDIILPVLGRDLIRLNYISIEDKFQILRIIDNAKSEINLQFLTYNVYSKGEYWSEVDSALINASARGVKVKLIISDWNLDNGSVAHFKFMVSHPGIEIRYTEIPEFSGGYIPYARVEHCKFITADSVCWIGTSNMSKEYFYNSRNVGMVVENGKFTQRVRDIFYKS